MGHPLRRTVAAALTALLPLVAHAAPGDVDALIKSAPRLAAGEYYLGMPRDEAMAKLKAKGLLDSRDAQPSVGFHFKQLPGHDFLAGSFGTTGLTGLAPNGSENVTLVYTMYPSPEVVTAVSRYVRYVVANAPNAANTLAALRAKYGHENAYDLNDLIWLFDVSGHPLSAAEVQKVRQAYCLNTGYFVGGRDGSGAYGPTLEERLGWKIGVGYAKSRGGMNSPTNSNSQGPVNDACLHVIYLHAIFNYGVLKPGSTGAFSNEGDSPKSPADWARVGNDLVPELTIYIYDAPLDYAASEASRGAVLAGGAQHEQQQQNAAKKNKPNL